jgi:sporulation protein YlmC with PRC-barrel domain
MLEKERTDKCRAASEAETRAKIEELAFSRAKNKALIVENKVLKEDMQIVEADLAIANTKVMRYSAQIIESSSVVPVESVYKIKLYESELKRLNLEQDLVAKENQLNGAVRDAEIILQSLDQFRIDNKALEKSLGAIQDELRDCSILKDAAKDEAVQLRAKMPDQVSVELQATLDELERQETEQTRASLEECNRELELSRGESQKLSNEIHELRDQVISSKYDVDVLLAHVEKFDLTTQLSKQEAALSQVNLGELTQQYKDSRIELEDFRSETDNNNAICEEKFANLLRNIQAQVDRCESRDSIIKRQKDLFEIESQNHTLTRDALAAKMDEFEIITREHGELVGALQDLTVWQTTREVKSVIKKATFPITRVATDHGSGESKDVSVNVGCLKRFRGWFSTRGAP